MEFLEKSPDLFAEDGEGRKVEAKRLNDDRLVEVPELQHGVLQRGGNSLFNKIRPKIPNKTVLRVRTEAKFMNVQFCWGFCALS